MAGVSLNQVQRMGLQQMLAPHMQLSLHLLQAATPELCDLVKQELEKNPTLEEVPQETVSLDQPSDAGGESPRDGRNDTDDFRREFETLKEMDDEWRDYFTQNSRNYARNAEDEERRQFQFDSIVQPETLQEHLLGQLGTSDADGEIHQAAETIIGSLTDDGYLLAQDDLGAALTDAALQVCAGLRTSDPAVVSWARTLVLGALTEAFEKSKRVQLLGWQERLQDICRQLLAPKPEGQAAPATTSAAPAAEPVNENAIKPAGEAIARIRGELTRQLAAMIEDGAPLPLPREALADIFTGATAEELNSVLETGHRLDLPLLFLRPGP